MPLRRSAERGVGTFRSIRTAGGPSEASHTQTDRPDRLGRDFRILWAGQSVSLIGDQLSLLAIPLAAVQVLDASTLAVALLAAALRLPFLLIGLPAGVWVDRIGLRSTMLIADLVRGVAIVSLPIAALLTSLTFTHLLTVALALGIGTVFFQVAYQSYTPLLIRDRTALHAANTRLSFSESTALLVGPGLAGLVIAGSGAVRALVFDVATYLLSVVTLLAIQRRETSPAASIQRGSVWREVRAGVRYVLGQPVLRAILWCGVIYNAGFAMYEALLAVFAVRTLDLSPATLGLALGLGGAGFPVGSLLARWLDVRFGVGPGLIVSALPSILGLMIATLAFGGLSIPLLAIGTFLNGVGQGSFAVNALTLRQTVTQDRMRSRATAVHRFATWGVLPIGALFAGVVGTLFGLRIAMLLAALLSTICLAPLLRSPLLAMRTLDG